MEFNQDVLNSITDFAQKGFNVRETAFLLCVEPTAFEVLFEDDTHPAVIAYRKGLFMAEFQLRQCMMDSALSGSGPAQAEMHKIFTNSKQYLNSLTNA